jgi:hypothetical protein
MIYINVIAILLKIICVGSFVSVSAQTIPAKDFVKVTIDDENATSELLRMPTGAYVGGVGADIGIMYFGPKSESDLSVILYMKGIRGRYSSEGSYGIKLFTDDVALRSNSLRGVQRVVKEKELDRIHFHLRREELAWLATGNTLKFEIFDMQASKQLGSVSFSKEAVAEFKRFAKSVLLIISTVE